MRISHFYYGAWKNFYHLSWPMRFLVELIVLYLIVSAGIWMLKKIVHKFHLNNFLIKGWVWFITEIIYLIAHGRSWGVEFDNKMIAWGERAVNNSNRKKTFKLNKYLFAGAVVLYLAAIFVDLPFAKGLETYYLSGFIKIKEYCQKYETMLSGNYEQYPPLFINRDPKAEKNEVTATGVKSETETIYIQLNERGKNGANVREEPQLSSSVVGGVNKNSEILYLHQFEHDGERYWIKVYLPADEIEGWLSGNLIASDQLEAIVTESGK